MRQAARVALAGLALAGAGVGVLAWPLVPWMLGLGLAAYGAILWVWPIAWLVLLPALAPLVDLSLWTGWLLVGEQDLLVLVTLAVLLVRAPAPMPALSRAGWVVLGLMGAATLIGLARGLAVAEPPGGSDLVYLSAWNALRVAKPWLEVMALLPFLAAALRRPGGTDWLIGGMIALAGLICIPVLVERQTFTGLASLSTEYRVMGSFASMHVGGGHIGAALAFTLPFVIVGLGGRLRWAAAIVLLPSLYALAVTFARAAYGAGLAAGLVTAAVALVGAARGARGSVAALVRRAALPVAGALALMGGLAVIALETPSMADRFAALAPDLALREGNWRAGFDLHGAGPGFWATGMGLGSFLRLSAAASAPTQGPSYYRVEHAPAPFLRIVTRSQFYVGHRVGNGAIGARLVLGLRWRAHAADPDAMPPVTGTGRLIVDLCQNIALYSIDCADATIAAATPGAWEDVHIPLTGPGDPAAMWPKPLELSLFSDAGSVIDIADVSLSDERGREFLANGDFSAGTQRWLITDDHHLVWRIIDQYLTILFETGLLGLAGWVGLVGLALRGAWRVAERGQALAGAAIAGAIAAMAVNFLFDAVLEAPRLALVIELVLVAALLLGEQIPSGQADADGDGAVV